jgi:hypothetical protein
LEGEEVVVVNARLFFEVPIPQLSHVVRKHEEKGRKIEVYVTLKK